MSAYNSRGRYGRDMTKAKNYATPKAPRVNASAQIESYTVDTTALQERQEGADTGEDKEQRVINGDKYKNLNVNDGEVIFIQELTDGQEGLDAGGVTVDNGLLLDVESGFRHSSEVEAKKTVLGIVGRNVRFAAHSEMNKPAHLLGDVRVVVEGPVTLVNQCHPGAFEVRRINFPLHHYFNVWPPKEEFTPFMMDAQETVTDGAMLEIYQTPWDLDARLIGSAENMETALMNPGGKCTYMDSTKPGFWDIYKYTKTTRLDTSHRITMSMRIIPEETVHGKKVAKRIREKARLVGARDPGAVLDLFEWVAILAKFSAPPPHRMRLKVVKGAMPGEDMHCIVIV